MGAGEFVWNSGGPGTNVFNGSIAVPSGVSLGSKRMRVRCTYLQAPNNPCTLYDFGECEDYNIEVVNNPNTPPVCPGITICSGTQTLLTASGTGLLQWFNAPTGGALLQNGPNFMTPILSSSTTYYVQSSSGNCPTARTAVTVTVSPGFSINLSATEDTVCINETTTLSATGGLGYSWSPASQVVSGSGGTVVVTAPIQTSFSVTATNAAGCTSTASILVFTHTQPTASIFPTNPAVCLGDTLMLYSTGGQTFQWNGPGIITPTNHDTIQVTPTVNSNYDLAVTDLNGCTVNVTSSVIVHALPIISAGPDVSICHGSAVTLNSTGGVSYQWSPASNLSVASSASPVCTAPVTTTYTLTGWDANGCQQTDDIQVNVNPLPIANPGSSASFCSGTGTQLNGSGGISYLWSPSTGLSNPNVSNPFANPASTTSYSLIVTDNNGCSSAPSSPISITVNPLPSAPTVSISGPSTFCSGDSVTLTSSYPNGNQWSNGSTGASITVLTPGTYNVQHTDANGCVSPPSVGVQVTVNGLPTSGAPVASGPISFCSGGSVTLSMPAGFNSYSWSNGSNSSSTLIQTTGTYSCIVTDANGCTSASIALGVTVFPNPPSPTILPSTGGMICPGDSITLSVSPTSVSCLWSNGSGTSSITVGQAGSYSVIITDLNNCNSAPSGIFNVQFYPTPALPILQASGSIPFCQGQTVTLSTMSPLANYFWSNGSTTSSITIGQAGSFSVYGEDANGCLTDTSAAISVSLFPVPAAPTISSSGPLNFCAGNSVQLFSSQATGNTWSNGQPGNSITITQTTIGIQVGYTDSNGCASLLSQPVDVMVIALPPTPVITSNGSLSFCQGDSLELICSQAQTYVWSTGETTPSIWVRSGGTYTVNVSDVCNPLNPQGSVDIVVYPNPIADFIIEETKVCLPMGITMINQSSGSGLSFQWVTGDGSISTETNLNYSYQFPGRYGISLIVSDQNGCTSIKTYPDSVDVFIAPAIEYHISPSNTADLGEIITGKIINKDISEGQWNLEGTFYTGNEFRFIPEQPGIFHVNFNGKSIHGCQLSLMDSIEVLERNLVFFPNSFTPNGDGKNDYFQPVAKGIEDQYELSIYDRWGSLLFFTGNEQESWDGSGVAEGVYIWKLKFRGTSGGTLERVGQVTLYR